MNTNRMIGSLETHGRVPLLLFIAALAVILVILAGPPAIGGAGSEGGGPGSAAGAPPQPRQDCTETDPDSDLDGIPDLCDNCPAVANADQTDTDRDGHGNVCDNCPGLGNPAQEDSDLDGVGDICDNCPTIPNEDQDPCVCAFCGTEGITISFKSPLGKGSGVVSWSTVHETDVRGFNVVVIDNRGNREKINDVMIPCLECTTGLGASYSFLIPKHKSGRGIFVELLRLDGTVETNGPAKRAH